MSNAFNTIDRNLIMNQCKEHFPELLAWAKFCYGDHPKLWHILGSLSSQHGVQQGDPLGPLFFALGLHSVVKAIDAECQLLLHCWYLEDGVFCGTKSDVTKLLRILNEATPITVLNVKLSNLRPVQQIRPFFVSSHLEKASRAQSGNFRFSYR